MWSSTARRRGEHEFVLGNIIGSNLFNTLAVVGLATVISPLVPGANGEPAFSHYILTRDLPAKCQLPDEIPVGTHGNVIRRPAAWK